MKKTLLSLATLLCMATASMAQVTFTCTAGKNFGQNEGIDKLFDGNVNTKYCQNAGDDCYALVTASEPVYVWGYDMTTANDNEQYGRCVTRWTLCGTNDENVASDPNAAGWVTLSGFGANNFVQRKNYYTQRFFCDKTSVATAYKYFKVVLNEGGFIQVSEFAFLSETRPVVTYNWESSSNDNSKKAVDWLLGQKWEGNNLAGNWMIIETNDQKAHPVESYSFTTNDDGSWPNRAPKTWKVEGSNDKESWETIDEVTEGDPIENANYKTFEFTPSNTTGAYRYVKLTLNSMKGTGWTQIGEFHVKGGYQYTPDTCPEHDILGSYKKATCLEAGYINGTCWKCGYSDNSEQPATGVHTYTDGVCDDCGWIEALNVEDGFVTISNAAELDLFSSVSKGSYYKGVKGKLTADIVANAAYSPIGTDDCRFTGTLDGQGHSITLNLVNDKGHQGLIGYADGGCTVKNLIVKGQVKTTGEKTAAIIAEAHGAGTVTVENCGNEANVMGAGGETSAIVANNWGGSCTVIVRNVYNTGDINGTGDVSAICAYGCDATNVYNTGNITGAKLGLMLRYPRSVNNCYSTVRDGNDNENVKEINVYDVASGKLCHMLGGTFTQDLGNDAYPVFGSKAVYAATVGASGWATYVAPATVDLSRIKENGGECYTVSSIDEYVQLGTAKSIEAGTAIIINAAEGTYYINECNDPSLETNLLQAATTDVIADGSQYILAENEGVVGFYKATPETTIAKGKAYLVISSSEAKAFYGFGENGETAIKAVSEAAAEGKQVYNLAGQRMLKAVKGINIINGKKIIK